MEDGESKHLLWDLAVSAAAHLRHLLRREFHTRKNAWGHQVTFRMAFESVRDLPRTSGCKGYSSLFYTGIEWVSWVISGFTVVLLVFPEVAL